MAAHRVLVSALVVLTCTPAIAWKNGGQSVSLNSPIFGTHDWLAFKAYEFAGRPAFIKDNLNRYFIGTEAPDTGVKPADANGAYHDPRPCHCILFDDKGGVTQNTNEVRTREEFDKAVAALADGKSGLAAFYAGALTHYVGDLAQFCHVMGKQSHWGDENKILHGNYEAGVEKTIRFQDRTSTLFEAFIAPLAVGGNSPEEIARIVALRVERGTGTTGRDPGFMHKHYAGLKTAKIHLKAEMWDQAFRDQTGQNLNVAANGIAKLLLMIVEEGS